MAETLVNNFLLGADPELVLLDPPTLINGAEHRGTGANFVYGWDHGGYVLEPHPEPALSARQMLHNLKKSLDVAAADFPKYRFKAGAYYQNARQRSVTMGGHVHLDIPTLSNTQITAMDIFGASLEELDILPSKECRDRVASGLYGRKSDVRTEHGHVEYRSLCSWLFSRKTSMLCVTGIKLCAVSPESVKTMSSIKGLKSWLECFKGKDDDVDWILNRGYFDKSMEAKPDSDVKNVWRVDPTKAPEILKEAKAKIPVPIQAVRNTATREGNTFGALHDIVQRGVRLNRDNERRLAQFVNEAWPGAQALWDRNSNLI